jgi:hypothetical protein
VRADANAPPIREKNATARKAPVAEERPNPIVARSAKIDEDVDIARKGGSLFPD